MNTTFGLYNFIADTCILVVIAYLLARGRMLTLLFQESLTSCEVLLLGFVMGLVGLVEAIFPDAALPYATHTLFVIFATIVGGFRELYLDHEDLLPISQDGCVSGYRRVPYNQCQMQCRQQATRKKSSLSPSSKREAPE